MSIHNINARRRLISSVLSRDIRRFYRDNVSLTQVRIAELFSVSQAFVSKSLYDVYAPANPRKIASDPVSLQGEGTYIYQCTKKNCWHCYYLQK